jgi:branched-chain amino acid transport system substrate-binding protein
MADYCAKKLNFKRMITVADDFAFGHEMTAGFQRVFEDAGGKIVQKLFPPLAVPDYGTYIAQLKTDVDGVFLGFAGSNGFRFTRQVVEYGLKDKIVPIGGTALLDETVLRNMGDEALGIKTTSSYSPMLDNPQNQAFAPKFREMFGYDPGLYAALLFMDCEVFDTALQAASGRIEDKPAFMEALRQSKTDTIAGPVTIDAYGNGVGNIYIREVVRKDGRLVNDVIDTYENVSQFWTYDPKEFLANPVYSRDFPPARYIEN